MVRLTDTQIERADRLAKKTEQARATLLKKIIVDAMYGPDAQDVLSGKVSAKWR